MTREPMSQDGWQLQPEPHPNVTDLAT